MNRIIVAVFESDEEAFKGQSAMKDLHLRGDISIYASAVVSKNEEGELKIKSLSEKGPLGTRVGMISGAFVGILAGPLGMALGASVGALGGLIVDSAHESFGEKYIDEIANELENGNTVVITEVEEGWKTPVDTKMAELNCMVFRFNSDDKLEPQLQTEWDSTLDEISELEQELELVSESGKGEIERQMDNLKKKMVALKEYAEKELKNHMNTAEVKMVELEKQIASGGEKTKKKLEKRLLRAEKSFMSSKQTLQNMVDQFDKEVKKA